MLLIKIDKYGCIKNINKSDITFLNNYTNVSHLYSWIFNTYEYKLYGSTIGNAGNENKYELPPPVDNNLYFNNLFFIKTKDDSYLDLTINDYNNFYNTLFQGFEDILDADDSIITEELSEHTSDRDFINDDETDISSEDYELENSNSFEASITITCSEDDNTISNNNISNDDISDDDLYDNTQNSSSQKSEVISSIEFSISSSDNECDEKI